MKKSVVIGIIALIAVSPLFRGLYFSFEAYGFLAALALLSVLYFFVKVSRHETVQVNKLFAFFGVLMVAAVAISSLNAKNPRENLWTLLLYIELFVVFIILYDYFHDKKRQFLQMLLLPVVIAGTVSAFVGLMALTGRFSGWHVTVADNRIGSTFQYSNTASIYFAVCFMFALALANAYKSIFLRALMTGLGNIAVFAFFMTGSRGGYIAGFAVVLLLLAIQPSGRRISGAACFVCMLAPVFIVMKGFNASTAAHDNAGAAMWLAVSFVLAGTAYLLIVALMNVLRKKVFKDKPFAAPRGSGLIFAGLAAVCVVLAVVFRNELVGLLPPIMAKRLGRLLTQGVNDVNVLYRLDFDRDALKLIAANWLTGIGGGGWKAAYQSVQDYFYTAVFVHNQYFQVFAEHGILGFLSYTGLVLLAAIGAFFSFIRAGDSILKTYAAGLLCGFIALAGHSAADFDLSFVSLTLLFWAMFAASAVGLPDVKLPLTDRWKGTLTGGVSKMALLIICSILLSVNALYFAAARNRQTAFDYMQKKDYESALVFYEEAYRLDPGNTNYTFELARLYHYFSRKSSSAEYRQTWLSKARTAGEMSVEGNRDYPAHMSLLIQIYLDSGMPPEALEYSERLVSCQRYNAYNYELLARSYIEAAKYYEENGSKEIARELLDKCVGIDGDPYLRRSLIDTPHEVNSVELVLKYEHSEELAGYLEEAGRMLEKY